MKWIAPLLAYLAVGIGLFILKSAWGALLGFHTAIIVSLLIAKPKIPMKILITNKNIKWIFLSVILCGSSGITLHFFWNSFGIANDLPTQVASLGLNASTWPLFIIYLAVVNSFVEEYFWRGYLGSKTKSLHTSDFLYAGFHGLILINKVKPVSILFGLSVLVFAGWFWRQIFREDNGLFAPVLGHMSADLTILVAVYRMII
jgi:membrane protease YdiL (CAAX protease family)